jgi:hypothetical protein
MDRKENWSKNKRYRNDWKSDKKKKNAKWNISKILDEIKTICNI